MSTADPVGEGRRSFERSNWLDAYNRLGAADVRSSLAAEDLERLATAAYLTGRDDESTDVWARAHQAWRDRGNPTRAIRAAFWAGFGLVQRGEMAQGSGWMARASRLLEQHRLDCVDRGYLLLPEAIMALEAGDPGALEQLDEIRDLAERFDDRDLATLAALGRGQALIGRGLRSDGMRLFDEAMVSVTAGETSPVISGLVYCAVIGACHRAFDLRRAAEWTSALERWCEGQPDLVPFRGQCLVHRAQIMQVRGNWTEALAEARRACDRLAEPPHPAIGMAHYQLAELHRLRGDVDAAESEYQQAHGCGHDPQPGLALVRLAEGRIDAAVAAITGALSSATDGLRRLELLPAYVEIMLSAGQASAAQDGADELADLAASSDTALLAALADQSRGAVLLAQGQPKAALEVLRRACRALHEIQAPFEEAQVRLLIAAACRAVGDEDGVGLECAAARGVFERLNAGPALARLDELVNRAARVEGLPVTARERDVLRHVAAGRTNREIAEALVISEKTVERHLGNIFTKLGVSNRAAATAYAYDHGLV